MNNPVVTLNTTKGVITIELYPKIAPNTVNNFISLVNKGFYNGLIFHRVISDFMIQGGCPEGTGRGNPGYRIVGEFSGNGFENNLKHTEGVISMARSSIEDSAGSQFFIMVNDVDYLDGQYAAFGKTIEGYDVVKTISLVDCDGRDRPYEDVVILDAKVDTFGVNYDEPAVLGW